MTTRKRGTFFVLKKYKVYFNIYYLKAYVLYAAPTLAIKPPILYFVIVLSILVNELSFVSKSYFKTILKTDVFFLNT